MNISRKLALAFLCAALLPLLAMGVSGITIFSDFRERLQQNRQQALVEAQRRLLLDVRDKALMIRSLLLSYQNDVETLRRLHQVFLKDSGPDETPFCRLYSDKPTGGLPACGYLHPEYQSFGNWDKREYDGSIWITRPVMKRVQEDDAFRRKIERQVRATARMIPILQAFYAKNRETCDLSWIFLTDGVANNYPYDLETRLRENRSVNDLDENLEPYVREFSPERHPDRSVGWIPAYLDASKQIWMTSCVAPIYDDDRFAGTVGLDIIISSWLDWLMKLNLGEETFLFVIDDQGRPLAFPEAAIQTFVSDPLQSAALREAARPTAGQTWKPELVQAIQKPLEVLDNPDIRALFGRMKAQESGILQINLPHPVLAAYAPVGVAGWSIGIIIPKTRALSISETARQRMDQALQRYGMFFAAVFLLAAIFSIMIGFWSSSVISRPISGMITSIQELSRGGEWRPLEAKNDDELKILADSANVMVQKLRDNEKLLSDIFNGVSDAIFLHDGETGAILRVNRKMCDMYKCTEQQALAATMQQISTNLPPYTHERAKELIQAALKGELPPFQWHCRDFQGNAFWGEVSLSRARIGERIGVLAVVRDISERVSSELKRLELERNLLQTQKLESLGVMAGGVAHDFNNLLMAILGHADLASMALPGDAPALEHLHQIRIASERAADLCRQMLAYSGRGTFKIESVDLVAMVKELTHMLRTAISRKAELCLHLAPGIPAVQADATQIRQVLMNLVINASDALGEQIGTITVSVDVRVLDAADLTASLTGESLEPGRYVCLEVADTGCGMTEEVQQRIFEPFYTTKFTGRGLGLSAVRGIVKGHRGLLRVRSKAGCGTCFTVALPAQAVEKKAEEPVNQVASIRNTGIVLFVEDEPLLQQLGQKMLKTLGLNSLVAGDGIEAVRMYKERGHEISVVMLDMTMPYMNGEETYHELRKIDPNVTVILASGYTESELHERFTNCPIAGFMHKPYNLSTMREALRKVLNRSRET